MSLLRTWMLCVSLSAPGGALETRNEAHDPPPLRWEDVFNDLFAELEHPPRERLPDPVYFEMRIVDAVIVRNGVRLTVELDNNSPIAVRAHPFSANTVVGQCKLWNQRGQCWYWWRYEMFSSTGFPEESQWINVPPGACTKFETDVYTLKECKPRGPEKEAESPRDVRRRAAGEMHYRIEGPLSIWSGFESRLWAAPKVKGEGVVRIRLSDDLDLMDGAVGDDWNAPEELQRSFTGPVDPR